MMRKQEVGCVARAAVAGRQARCTAEAGRGSVGWRSLQQVVG